MTKEEKEAAVKLNNFLIKNLGEGIGRMKNY